MKRAFVFPGQGAQAIGMGRALAERWPETRAVFDEVDAALGEKLSTLIWEGEAEALTLTRNAQPALMATSMAAFRALAARGVTIAAADAVAGHSLGEYSALTAAGALTLPDAARLLRLRGEAMQDAVPAGVGAMAAVMGLTAERLEEIAAQAARDTGGVCAAANDNDPGQVVISGHAGAVEHAIELARAAGARRALKLPVSAPFHCQLMAPAAAAMAGALDDVEIAPPAVPLYANVTAAPVTDPAEIRTLLVDQVCGRVRWRQSVEAMRADGIGEFWEIGPGKALSGMIRRIDRAAETRQVATPDEVEAAVEALTG